MSLQCMLNEAMQVSDWMRKEAYIFERKFAGGFAVVDKNCFKKMKDDEGYKYIGVVYPKP